MAEYKTNFTKNIKKGEIVELHERKKLEFNVLKKSVYCDFLEIRSDSIDDVVKAIPESEYY